MSFMKLRFLGPFIYIRPAKNLARHHVRFYSGKKLATSRPDLQPQARRKHLKDLEVPLYPRITDDAAGGKVMSFSEIREKYEQLMPKDYVEEIVTIRGRIKNYRDVSSKLIFYDLLQDGRKLQAVMNWKTVGGSEEEFGKNSVLTRAGDVVSVTGRPGRTNAGELSIMATSHITLLTPCLHVPPPTITDPETRLRNRHVDLLIRPEATQILRLRSKIIHHLRTTLLSQDFVEVQTPILSDNAGGAIAKPFTTIATAYRNKKLSLRIAPELWLKRLVIGGMERIFEIGAQFRNEGIDATHNPEFTTCEFYQAYASLEDLIAFTENFFQSLDVIINDLKTKEPEFTDKLMPIDLDFKTSFQRLEFIPALESAMLRPLPDLDSGSVEEVTERLLILLKDLEIPPPASPTVPRILDKLSAVYLEPQCIDPTFITHHPEALSPLAKSTTTTTGRRVSERMELFIAGKELVNAYEEENSPSEQRRKFEVQTAWRDPENCDFDNSNNNNNERGGDGDGIKGAAAVDEAFLNALEWGLPPTGGWGLGVDRLVMLFAGVERIGEVLAFGGLRGVVNQDGGGGGGGGGGKGGKVKDEEL